MKLFVVVFLGIIAAAFGRSFYKNDDRIVGGEEVEIESYPYQVSFESTGFHMCGGSILNEDTIISATHCLEGENIEDLSIKAGVTNVKEDGEVFKIAKIIEHPGFNEDYRFNNDLCILKLDGKLTFNDKIQPIEIATEAVADGTEAVVSGWGATQHGGLYSDVLRAVTVNVVNHEQCAESYKNKLSDKMLCASAPEKDACKGDSGGPLVADGKLIGIVSFGLRCVSSTHPGVYADVVALQDFIKENM